MPNCPSDKVLVIQTGPRRSVESRCEAVRDEVGAPVRRHSLKAAGYANIKKLTAAVRREALLLAVAQNGKELVLLWLERLVKFNQNRDPRMATLVTNDIKYVKKLRAGAAPAAAAAQAAAQAAAPAAARKKKSGNNNANNATPSPPPRQKKAAPPSKRRRK